MPLPESIPVRYTEEEAGYVSFRPVVRQTFRSRELLDMILSVTGKDVARIRQILRSGTVVFHFYRYWWQGFEVAEQELRVLLAGFPDPDPRRPFRADECSLAIIEAPGSPPRASLEVAKSSVSHRGLLRRRSFWDVLLNHAAGGPLAYGGYSYGHHADVYRLELTPQARAELAAAAASLAPRNLRHGLQAVQHAARILFTCPRLS